MDRVFSDRYGPWAVIAGGSEGIGFSFARQLAEQGVNLVLIGRRPDVLARAAATLGEQYAVQVRYQSLDLTSESVADVTMRLASELEVGLVVYNAGAAHGAAMFLDGPLDAAEKMVALNCRGPLLFCHHFGSAMRRRGRGGIILLSSLSGLAGGAYVAAYAATKAFDAILAEGLWAELKPFGVDVLGLIAGATQTPAMLNSGVEFGDFQPMHADDVAREAFVQLGRLPVWVAGEGNRHTARMLRAEDRQTAIGFISAGAAALYKKPNLL